MNTFDGPCGMVAGSNRTPYLKPVVMGEIWRSLIIKFRSVHNAPRSSRGFASVQLPRQGIEVTHCAVFEERARKGYAPLSTRRFGTRVKTRATLEIT